MQGRRTEKRELVGLWLALGILGIVAALTYRSIDATVDTLGWVEHAQDVLQQLDDVSAAYARAVTARRAFVISGDASQLADTGELDARTFRLIQTMHDALADDPGQQGRLSGMAKSYQERLASLDAAVARRRRDGVGAETPDSVTLAVRIRSLREAMSVEEGRLLLERNLRTRRDVTRTKLIEVGGTLVSFGILLFAFGRLRHEVARRRASEKALRSHERFLDSIVENIPDALFVKSAADLHYERINRAGELLLGITRAEILGKRDVDVLPAAQAAVAGERDRETLDEGRSVEILEQPLTTTAGTRWIRTKKVPVLDETGSPLYLLGIAEDVTESRDAAAALKAAKETAEAANLELESFSYSVAHDLRAPLRAIDGFSEALLEDCAGQLDGEALALLKRVRAGAVRMSELIDGLLSLARVTRGELRLEPIDLTRLARQIGDRLRESHPERDVELLVEEGLVTTGDSRLVAAALDNLLANAWKFTRKGERPRVEFGAQVEGGERAYFVRDNGAGFDQAYAKKLFGAFQRLHAVTEFEGTGIGLATVKRIVRRHGGRVWAEGATNRGATFFFTLPATHEGRP